MRAQSDRNSRPHAKRVDTNVDDVPDRGSTPLASTTVFSKPLRLKGFSVGRCPEDVGEVPDLPFMLVPSPCGSGRRVLCRAVRHSPFEPAR